MAIVVKNNKTKLSNGRFCQEIFLVNSKWTVDNNKRRRTPKPVSKAYLSRNIPG